MFSLTRQVMTAGPQLSIGPNPVLPEQKFPSQQAQALSPAAPHNTSMTPLASNSTPSIPTTATTTLSPRQPGTGDRLLNLVQGAYLALNFTDPNKTQDCWLCLVSRPPYYEGMAVLGNYTNQTSAPTSCTSIPQHKLTLSEESGQGLCIGTIPKTHQALCNSTQKVSRGTYYLAAPNGTYWACSTGLTPCVSAAVLSETSDYCVLIELWPKVTYHDPEYIYSHFEGRPRFRREPASLTLTLLLGGITMG